ncbi:MAG: endonuclease/exonuclease/phosphatase family protein [Muribaculaceae bacterium]|nr:endonuclease/exonuclease/phosphatase family protein [Muribaculaceae bacterium]
MKLRNILLTLALLMGPAALAHTDTLTVMTLNLHAGRDASLEQIGLFIKQYNPDFVALQEVDLNTHRANCRHQNGRDFITELAYHSGMQGLFCPTIKFSGGLYGIGLLTRHPFVEVQNIMLPHPNPKMEQRGLLQGTFVLPDGDTVVMACTHLEAFDSLSRVAQAQFILSHFDDMAHPAILAGDFNAPPLDPAISMLTTQWTDCTPADQPTFSTTKPTQKIDYILTHPAGIPKPESAWRVLGSQVIPIILSDHFPVITTLLLTHP